MIVVYGSIRLKEDGVQRVADAIPGFLDKIRAEDGYIAYSLTWDPQDPQVLHLLEHWESAEAHEVHMPQPHVKEWAQMMSEVADGPLQAQKFNAEVFV